MSHLLSVFCVIIWKWIQKKNNNFFLQYRFYSLFNM